MNAMLKPHIDNAPLQAHGISKRYDGRPVLDAVDLTLPEGAVLGLIGRNGAGKSTLIRALMGLIEVDAGSATVLGEPALAMGDRVKEQLGYVPQQPDALGWLRIDEMFALLRPFYPRWDQGFVDSQLDRTRLPRDRALAKLSPGERQQVALIRALAVRPSLLVLDEPAAALDPVARRELLREIALRAGESGTSVLFSTHIVSDLERVASHVAFLHEGRMLLQAPLDDLKERYARLWLPGNAPPAKVAGEISRRPQQAFGGWSLVVEQRDGRWPAEAQQPGARIEALGLEDLFVEIAE
ncbi:ABC transporter ATP-binding protein [Metallibacterium sp.]|uniref:ABC transporter ATP-binding protein n=1 Tax=Metallibacterium sp. TaxID=2940281 RepID=UPI002619BC77|nr:ABC transporter ATP-binding protein [Metallibacterium sp.]